MSLGGLDYHSIGTRVKALVAAMSAFYSAAGDIVVGTGALTYTTKSIGNDGDNLRVNSAATGKVEWKAPAVLVASGRNITGRTNATNPNSQVNFTSDEVVLKNTTGGARIESTVSPSADITQTGVSGLDTGVEAGSTWYYKYAIAKLNPLAAVSVTADAATDRFTYASHGLAANTPVQFAGGAVPTGLVTGTTYFIRDVTTNDFKVAATVNGAAIDLTSAGTTVTMTEHPGLMLSVSATAPTMPSGYTFKALVGAVRNDGGSNFVKYRQLGGWVYYEAHISLYSSTSTAVETAVSLTAVMPSIAQSGQYRFKIDQLGGAPRAAGSIRVVSGSVFALIDNINTGDANDTFVTVPNIAQNLWVFGANSDSNINLSINAFRLSVGGD